MKTFIRHRVGLEITPFSFDYKDITPILRILIINELTSKRQIHLLASNGHCLDFGNGIADFPAILWHRRIQRS